MSDTYTTSELVEKAEAYLREHKRLSFGPALTALEYAGHYASLVNMRQTVVSQVYTASRDEIRRQERRQAT